MTILLRFPLGVVLGGGGGALTIWSAAAAFALMQTRQGLPMPLLFAFAVGLFMLGGSIDLLRRRRAPGAKEGVVAKSVWATREDVDTYGIGENPRKPDEGLYLGYFAGEGEPTQLRFRGTKHGLFFGTPGANKSMGIVASVLADARRSAIVIDLKGQLRSISGRKRATFGKNITLNAFGVLVNELPHLQSDAWNPMHQLPKRYNADSETVAGVIADAVIEKSADAKNQFFDMSADTFTTAWVIWERESKGDKANLANIRSDLSQPTIYDKATKEPVSGFLHTLKLMSQCDIQTVSDAGGRLYARLTDPNSHATSAQDVVDTILSHTKFLNDPHIRTDMANGGAIDFGALHREITTIYLILPPHQLVAQAKWLRLFINVALAELYKHPPGRDATLPPVLFMLDEFGNLGRLSQILSALNISRDYSLQLWMFLQNLGQLKTSYPKEWTSFFSGAGVLSTFATGDTETAEVLSKLLGNEEKSVPTETVNGISLGIQPIPIIRPEDMGRLGRGETINLIQPCPWPVRGVAPVYAQTPFADGLDPNPYYRGKP